MPLESCHGIGAKLELSTTLLQEPRAETAPAAFTPAFAFDFMGFFPSASKKSSLSLVVTER